MGKVVLLLERSFFFFKSNFIHVSLMPPTQIWEAWMECMETRVLCRERNMPAIELLSSLL